MAVAKNDGRLRVVKGKGGRGGAAGDPLPPCNPEAERNFLGSLLIDPSQAYLCDLLEPGDFYLPPHQLVFTACQTLVAAKKPLDIALVDEQLRDSGRLGEVGQAEVFALAANVVTSVNAPHYAEIVLNTSVQRLLAQLGAEITTHAYRSDGDVSGLLASAQRRLQALAKRLERRDEEDDRDGAALHGGPLSALTTGESFPLEALPGPIRDLVLAASYAIPCPPDLVALPALVAAASAIGHAWTMRVKRGYSEPPIIYAAIVARPGDGKSPAVGYAMQPIFARQEAEISAWRAQTDEWEHTDAEDREQTERPHLLQRFTTDTTIEALSDTLHDARSIVVVKDELHAWVTGMDAYKAKGRGSERDAWLSLWRAGQIMINRRNREGALYLHAPHVNVVGGIQEDRLGDLDDDQGRADGFLDRVLFAYPQPGELRYSEAEVDLETAHRYAQLIDDLYALPLAVNGEGKTEANGASFTPDGKDTYRAWCHALYAEMNDPSFPLAQRGAWMKLQAYAARLALILHLCRSFSHDPGDHVIRGQVDGVDVVNALTLVEYFKRQARKIHARLHANPDDLRLLGALEWIRRQPDGRVTAREVLHSHVANATDTDEARKLLDDLAARGWGVVEHTPVRGGRTSSTFTLKPEA